MPRMMSALLDQMRTLTDRVKRLETPEGRPKTSSGREILTTMEVANMLKLSRITVYRMASRGWKIRARVTPSAKADLTPNNFSVLTL